MASLISPGNETYAHESIAVTVGRDGKILPAALTPIRLQHSLTCPLGRK